MNSNFFFYLIKSRDIIVHMQEKKKSKKAKRKRHV